MKNINPIVAFLFLAFLLTGCLSDIKLHFESTTDDSDIPDEYPKLEVALNFNHIGDEESAVILGIETLNKLTLNELEYQRILNELSVLKAQSEAISEVMAVPSWDLNGIIIKLEEEALNDYNNSKYIHWDDANKKYGLKEIETFSFTESLFLTFDNYYNVKILQEEYGKITGVKSAFPNSIAGDSSDICLEIEDSIRHYIFDVAYGDCPAGCINHTYHGFTIDDNYNVSVIGTYVPFTISESNITFTNPPLWFEERSKCTSRL